MHRSPFFYIIVSMNQEKHEARALAAEILYSLDFNNELSSQPDLTGFPGKNEAEMAELSETAVFYPRFLVAGVLRSLSQVDSLISEFSINRPIERINYVDRNILRLSVFELLEVKDLHKSIIIDEAVKLSQELSTDVTYKFINGILDSISKKVRSDNVEK